MIRHKTYLTTIYSFLFILILAVTFTLIYLNKKANESLFITVTHMIEAPVDKMPEFFPDDSVGFYNHIMYEINNSVYEKEIIIRYFNNNKGTTQNMSIFIKSVLKTMVDKADVFLLTFINFKDINYLELEFQINQNINSYFSIIFIKENKNNKIYRINNLHEFLNSFALELE